MPYKDPVERRAKKREYQRRYRVEHKDEIRINDAEYRKQNRPAIRERKRKEYAATNGAYRKMYNIKNPDVIRMSKAARRARKADALIDLSEEQQEVIKEIYHIAVTKKMVKCYLCEKMTSIGDRHVDHIIPISKGGKHRPSNLAIACASCNLSKHDKMPNEIGLLL